MTLSTGVLHTFSLMHIISMIFQSQLGAQSFSTKIASVGEATLEMLRLYMISGVGF